MFCYLYFHITQYFICCFLRYISQQYFYQLHTLRYSSYHFINISKPLAKIHRTRRIFLAIQTHSLVYILVFSVFCFFPAGEDCMRITKETLYITKPHHLFLLLLEISKCCHSLRAGRGPRLISVCNSVGL